jgi:hypothetical protein
MRNTHEDTFTQGDYAYLGIGCADLRFRPTINNQMTYV